MTVDVALKVIPKKKVKGNESSVWSEMEVLKGLSHPNVVSPRIFVILLQYIASHPSCSGRVPAVVPPPCSSHMTSRLPRRQFLLAQLNLCFCITDLGSVERLPYTHTLLSSPR